MIQHEYDVVYPNEINLGDLAYFHGDLPDDIADFRQVTRIERGEKAEYQFYVDDPHSEIPYSIPETELVFRLRKPKLSDFTEYAQKKAARNSIAGLLADSSEIIQVYKNMLAAIANLDDPERAVQLLDMVIATGLPGAERHISSITSRCKNGHTETADIPENAGPQDIIEVLALLRGTCPECETQADYQEVMQYQAELAAQALEALNPSGLDPLPPENE